MKKYLPHILIISFVFLLILPILHAEGKRGVVVLLEWACSTKNFTESNITANSQTLWISLSMVRVYKDGFFNKNDGVISLFSLPKTCFFGRKIWTCDGYGGDHGEIF